MQTDGEVLRSATSKAMRRIVPFTMLMFVLSFLDRVNVGFAKQGIQRDTGMGDYAFAMGLSLFFVGYALFETPSPNTVQLSPFRNCRMALLKGFARHRRALNNAN